MSEPQVQKSAQAPQLADQLQFGSAASMRVVDVGVQAAEFEEHPNPFLKIALVLSCERLSVRWHSESGRQLQGRVQAGSCSVMPAQMPYATHWQGAGRMLLLSFSPEFLQARDEVLADQRLGLVPSWSQADPLLSQLGLAVLAARQAGLASSLYLDAAAEVALVHLQTRYSQAAAPAPAPLLPAGLVRVRELIEAELDQDLSLARLAAVAGMSVYGFARAFSRALGEPPHRYVLRRRCERAQQLLAHSSLTLADIAHSLGFSSQAHLGTVFVRQTGCTPAAYRRQARRSP
jgi:AraC family transcriptional regulator